MPVSGKPNDGATGWGPWLRGVLDNHEDRLSAAATIDQVNGSLPVQQHARNGKLDLKLLPDNVTLTGQEDTSKLLIKMNS